MGKKEIQDLFYKEKNYSEIKELLKDSNDTRSFDILGKINLYENNLEKAYEYFQKTNNIQNLGYIKFLLGNIDEALIMLSVIKGLSPFVNWILALISAIKDNKENIPSYFQIRNFYEQDLEKLFCIKQYKLFNQIISLNPYFELYNREIYKYTGRVLYNNNLIQEAKNFLLKSTDICYNDPETHFLLGEVYIKSGEKQSAVNEYKKAKNVTGEYLPAEDRLKDLLN